MSFRIFLLHQTEKTFSTWAEMSFSPRLNLLHMAKYPASSFLLQGRLIISQVRLITYAYIFCLFLKNFFLKRVHPTLSHILSCLCVTISKSVIFTFIHNFPITYTWMRFFLNSVYLFCVEFCAKHWWLQKFIRRDPAIQKYIVWGAGEGVDIHINRRMSI